MVIPQHVPAAPGQAALVELGLPLLAVVEDDLLHTLPQELQQRNLLDLLLLCYPALQALVEGVAVGLRLVPGQLVAQSPGVAIEAPGLHHHDVEEPGDEGPIPLLQADLDAVVLGRLIDQVNAPHHLVVLEDAVRAGDVHVLLGSRRISGAST